LKGNHMRKQRDVADLEVRVGLLEAQLEAVAKAATLSIIALAEATLPPDAKRQFEQALEYAATAAAAINAAPAPYGD
jgi:hypothetical protein